MDVVPTLLDLLGIDRAGDDAPGRREPRRPARRDAAGGRRTAPSSPTSTSSTARAVGLTHGHYKLVLGEEPLPQGALRPRGRPRGAPQPPRPSGVRRRLRAPGRRPRPALQRLLPGEPRTRRTSADDSCLRQLADLGYIAGRGTGGRARVPRRLEPADPFPDGRLGWAPGRRHLRRRWETRRPIPRCSPAGTTPTAPAAGALRTAASSFGALPGTGGPAGRGAHGNNFRPAPVNVTLRVNGIRC